VRENFDFTQGDLSMPLSLVPDIVAHPGVQNLIQPTADLPCLTLRPFSDAQTNPVLRVQNAAGSSTEVQITPQGYLQSSIAISGGGIDATGFADAILSYGPAPGPGLIAVREHSPQTVPCAILVGTVDPGTNLTSNTLVFALRNLAAASGSITDIFRVELDGGLDASLARVGPTVLSVYDNTGATYSWIMEGGNGPNRVTTGSLDLTSFDGQLMSIAPSDTLSALTVNPHSPTQAAPLIGVSHSVGSNVVGTNLTLGAGQSTGSAKGGDVLIQTSPAGGAGSSQNSLVTLAQFTGDSKIGLFGHAPAAQPGPWTISNYTTTHTLNGSTATLNDVINALGSLIADLQSFGGIG